MENIDEFHTGNSSQNNYTTYSSGNLKRRPYSSIHGMKKDQVDMRKYGAADAKDLAGPVLNAGGRSMSNILGENWKGKNGGSLHKTSSESMLLDVYNNSRLVATNDKLFKRLMNYTVEGGKDYQP